MRLREFIYRPPRFGIQMQVRYRLRNESKWWKGTTENISRTGVLFRGEEFAPPNTPLEMRLVLPGGIVGLQSAEVVCKGMVVRSGRPRDGRAYPALASTISHYRIIPP
jgi:hypothetical protein